MGKVVSAEVFLLRRKTVVLATAYGRPAQVKGQKKFEEDTIEYLVKLER